MSDSKAKDPVEQMAELKSIVEFKERKVNIMSEEDAIKKLKELQEKFRNSKTEEEEDKISREIAIFICSTKAG